MTSPVKRGGLLAVLSLCALASAAIAGPARFTKIDYPGAVSTVANGINPAGDIVGTYTDTAGHQHAFVRRGATFSLPIDYPGAAYTQGYGINPQGDIVGQYGVKGDGRTHGFLWRVGAADPVEVTVPDQPSTMPYGINPEGTIDGCVHGNAITGMHGFLVTADGNSTVDLNEPSGTMHTGINARGDVIGYGSDPALPGSDSSGYVIRNGALAWFRVDASTFTNPPGIRSTYTRPRGISPTGDIVGVTEIAEATGTKTTHGFLLRHGEFDSVPIDFPGATLTRAFGINAVGDIVGVYIDDAKITHGFLLSRRPQ